MPSQIGSVEDALIAKVQTVLEGRVRTVEWAPPDWDEDFVKRNLVKLPGVFLIFAGGPNPDPGAASAKLSSRWIVAAATRHVQEAKPRARGDVHEIGCYEILETIIPELDGFLVERQVDVDTTEAVGTLRFLEWDNSMALKLEKQALMVQSASFAMEIELPRNITPSLLVPFETFHGTYDIGQADGAPVTEDFVEMEQED